ncbi:polyprenyl synthetase family protein [soil metagenome]
MTSPSKLQELINQRLQELNFSGDPATLYEPIRYMMALGGKRIRPVLVLMGTELFKGDLKQALSAATGIEVFHNFTLLHDDIMDNAPLRRAMPTVHAKWNSNIAILSGDAMFVKACQLMMDVPDHAVRKVMEVFNRTALEVCEGQQLDMDFETEPSVNIDRYLDMIRLKTAVLVGCSLEVGAIIAGADDKAAQHLYDFGVNLGIAFQLQDDILDVYGDAAKFGKQVGGDIIANKKTLLLLYAIASASGDLSVELANSLLMPVDAANAYQKVEAVKQIYNRLNVREYAETQMQSSYELALTHLDAIVASQEEKTALRELAKSLMIREH